MKTAACLALVMALGSNCATAADFETPVGYDWSGPYIGVHGGYLWGDTDAEDNGIPFGGDTSGFIGGMLAGINVQDGDMVLGVEGDFGLGDVTGEGGVLWTLGERNTYEMGHNIHLRARAGVAPNSGPLLVFASAGVAIADFTFTVGDTGESTSSTYVAPSFGAGVEYGFTPNLSGRIEGLYDAYEMGSGLIMISDYYAELQNSFTARATLNLQF